MIYYSAIQRYAGRFSSRSFYCLIPAVLIILATTCSRDDSGINPNPTLPDLDLRSADNQYDYLIISHPDWYHELEQFADYRQQSGLATLRIPLTEITEDFPDTASIQQSIQDMITFALNNWQEPRPRFLLLAGNISRVPSVTIPSRFAGNGDLMESTITFDFPYALNRTENDYLPDIAVGRFPAANIRELQSMITKTISFERQGNFSEYLYKTLFLADSDTSVGNLFERTVELILARNTPLHPSRRIDIRSDSPFAGNLEDLFHEIENGSHFFFYSGFASAISLSRSRFFTVDHIENLPTTDKSFIFYSLLGQLSFEDPLDPGFVENLLAKETGGAVASVAPTGNVFLFRADEFLEGFFRDILYDSTATIGEAILSVQRISGGSSNFLDSDIRRYSLLGDPALRLPNFQ